MAAGHGLCGSSAHGFRVAALHLHRALCHELDGRVGCGSAGVVLLLMRCFLHKRTTAVSTKLEIPQQATLVLQKEPCSWVCRQCEAGVSAPDCVAGPVLANREPSQRSR